MRFAKWLLLRTATLNEMVANIAVCRWKITAPALGNIMQTLCARGGLEWETLQSYEQAAAA
eukprot:1673005-Pleurochrysis_carterae.AAC.1